MSRENTQHDTAEAPISVHEQITRFSAEDWQGFFALQANSPTPNERVKKAAVLFESIVSAYEINVL